MPSAHIPQQFLLVSLRNSFIKNFQESSAMGNGCFVCAIMANGIIVWCACGQDRMSMLVSLIIHTNKLAHLPFFITSRREITSRDAKVAWRRLKCVCGTISTQCLSDELFNDYFDLISNVSAIFCVIYPRERLCG